MNALFRSASHARLLMEDFSIASVVPINARSVLPGHNQDE
jgi:hypothetical protein